MLKGKNVLITGAAQRIGRAIALSLAGEGANIVVHYNRSEREAAELAEAIAALGADAWTCPADLADAEQTAALVPAAIEQAGAVDVLINNASIFEESSFPKFTLEDLHDNIRVNAYAPLVLARAFAAQGRAGHIVNFLDARIVDYDRQHVAYHLSKQMLYALTRQMAEEYAPAIQVNAVAPGLVLPPAGKDETYLKGLASTNPLNRHGRLEDVTAAVLFFLTNTFVTGQTVFVDGGRHMRGSFYG